MQPTGANLSCVEPRTVSRAWAGIMDRHAQRTASESRSTGMVPDSVNRERSASPSANGEQALVPYASLPSDTAMLGDLRVLGGFRAGDSGRYTSGAVDFLQYLHGRKTTLNRANVEHLRDWALTSPIANRGAGKLVTTNSFSGAQKLCEHAGQVGHLEPQTAVLLATCEQPKYSIERLRSVLAAPGNDAHTKDQHIEFSYRRNEANPNCLGGASGFLTYLHERHRTLDQATVDDFQTWQLTPISRPGSKGCTPNANSVRGARRICMHAEQVGHLSPELAAHVAGLKKRVRLKPNERYTIPSGVQGKGMPAACRVATCNGSSIANGHSLPDNLDEVFHAFVASRVDKTLPFASSPPIAGRDTHELISDEELWSNFRSRPDRPH